MTNASEAKDKFSLPMPAATRSSRVERNPVQENVSQKFPKTENAIPRTIQKTLHDSSSTGMHQVS